jgi:hypothetical protein
MDKATTIKVFKKDVLRLNKLKKYPSEGLQFVINRLLTTIWEKD